MFGLSICSKILRRAFLLYIILLSVVRLSAQQKGETVSGVFVSETSDSLPYQLYRSSGMDTSARYPLIIWLHGKGERGNDNKKQMTLIKKWLPDSLEKPAYQSFLLAPQCATDEVWSNYDKLAQQITFDSTSQETQLSVVALMEKIIQTYPVDTSRIYLLGISMGGFGVFDLITRYPDRFAAAIPVCGGADPSQSENLLKTAVWAFHGDKDMVVDKRHTIVPMEKIKDDNHKLTVYKDVGHDAWNKAFKEPGLLKWLYEQKK